MNNSVPQKIPTHWVKHAKGDFFQLLRLDLKMEYFTGKTGLYIVWYSGKSGSKVVYIGSGNISSRLEALIDNPMLREFSDRGTLYVTWTTSVEERYLSAARAWLFDYYNPILGERPDCVQKIEVNPVS